jgi:hypothetical protein
MKANEAPEKIYYAPYGDMRVDDPITENDIEYVRADAFIEKACSILKDISCPFEIIEQFKNRIR